MKVAFYTLGCKVNTYETQAVLNMFKNKNYNIVSFNDIADIYIINTCTVTNTSASKSRKIIRHAINQNKDAIVVVMGCYSQISSDDIAKLGVNIIVGTNERSRIVELVEDYISNKEKINIVGSIDDIPFEDMEVSYLEGKTRAFVKIQDGCNNYCSYCIIPYTRGNVRSKDKDLVIDEITKLVNNGYLEIVLTGIHTGHYGFKDYSFSNLLKDVANIEGLERLRISSIEITELDDEFLDVLKNTDIIVNHLHIPLQSGCDKTLKEMNRKYNKKYFKDKINLIRSIRPDIAITTDVIVGFPNEDEKDFKETYDFIKEIGFMSLHVFPYSKREGTKAAIMSNQVNGNVKKSRVSKLVALSKKSELEYMTKYRGKKITIIAETIEDNYLIGHSSNYLKVKVLGDTTELGRKITCIVDKIEYPYCIAKRIYF